MTAASANSAVTAAPAQIRDARPGRDQQVHEWAGTFRDSRPHRRVERRGGIQRHPDFHPQERVREIVREFVERKDQHREDREERQPLESPHGGGPGDSGNGSPV
jgi:hypothetical protein